METTRFVPFEHQYLKIEKIQNIATGEKLEITFATKLLYRYMWDRYNFFNSTGKKYFDNQVELALAIGATRRTVINCIESMTRVGLISKTQTKCGRGMHSNSYEMLDIFDSSVFNASVKGELGKKKVKASVPVARNRSAEKITPVLSEDDLLDCPF